MERESVEEMEDVKLMSGVPWVGLRGGEAKNGEKNLGAKRSAKSQKPHNSTRLLILVA